MSEEDLLKEIDWLRAELAATRAAIERVRTICKDPLLPGYALKFVIVSDVIRALDGGDA